MKDKIKNIFYFFNYFEWLCVILICILFKFLLYLADGSGFLITMQVLICILLSVFILAMKSERTLYTCDAYRHKCVYKTYQFMIDDQLYYVPVIVVYTWLGSRYIRVIDNSKDTHISNMSFFGLKSKIADNGFDIPSDCKQYCYIKEEDACYEIVQCKKYIDNKKMKYSRKIISNEVTIEFKK